MKQIPLQPMRRARGFTLVEILVVIAIIGILSAISIPAITGAVRTARTAAMRNECANFDQTIEAYRLKYGDYPPDFADWDIAQRHYRRVFPEILDSELALLFRMCDSNGDNRMTTDAASLGTYVPAVMDRAEALIWALGGFSSNPQRPFTGSGGPLSKWPGADAAAAADGNNVNIRPEYWQYNSERDNALMDLQVEYLTIVGPDSSMTIDDTNRTNSSDDGDLFPVYRYREDAAPFVYFDARTYRTIATNMMSVSGAIEANGFATTTNGQLNGVRPMLSDQLNSNVAPSDSDGSYLNTTGTTVSTSYSAEAHRQWKFVNENTFQILAPGLDGIYGIIASDPTSNLPLYWQYPIGSLVGPETTATSAAGLIRSEVSKYNANSWPAVNGTADNFEKDNVSNFSERSLEDDLP